MRIIGGRWRRKPLAVPEGLNVRPTSDRARESIFNVLESGRGLPFQGVADRSIGDIFAGTGAFGLEALSRGASRCLFIDNGDGALAVLRHNIQALGAGLQSTVFRQDVANLGPAPFRLDLVFVDPPYRSGLASNCLSILQKHKWLDDKGLIIVEHAKAESLAVPDGLAVIDQRRYGAAAFSFLTVDGAI